MNEDPMPELTIEEVLEGFASDVETMFTVLDDSDLDDDAKSDLVRKFEGIQELVGEARQLARSSADD